MFPSVLYTSIRSKNILNSDYMLINSNESNSICDCIKIKKVKYLNNFQEYYKSLLKISDINTATDIHCEISYNPTDFGFYKSKYWEFQKEIHF